MSAENVLINFVGKVDELQPAENALDAIIKKEGDVGVAWAKTSEKIAAGSKQSIDSTNKLAKSIDQMATATKSMDKVVVAGAYQNYLKQIQVQLGLTNKELQAYIQTARKSAQTNIFAAGTDEEIDQLTLSIEVMNEELEKLAAEEGKVEGQTSSLRARIREAKEELVAMAEAGLQGTPAFAALQEKAGELDDQMRDLNASIKNTGSDTKHIDGLISLAGGVAGGFAVAQGAAALFGDENEEVQKALLKVNAAMSILQGLQAVQNVLQKESAASLLFTTTVRTGQTTAVVAETAAEVANVAATEAATVAQTGLNTAMSLNPVGLLIIGILAAVAAFSAFSDEVESSEDRIDRLKKKAEDVYTALQQLSKINQAAIDTEVEIVKNKELVNVLEAQNASVQKINAAKKVGLQLENDRLRDELANVESAKSLSEDKTQFVERELDVKSRIYQNDQAQLLLDIETNKVLAERALKSSSANADAEVAKRKLAIVQNQVDSIASIKAVSDAEIEAIKRKRNEELNPANNLTPGEIAKINAEADLAIAENKKALQIQLEGIEVDGIEKRVVLAKKGSEEEYNAKLALLEKEKEKALSETLVTQNGRLKIIADFNDKKKALDDAFQAQQIQDEISYFNRNLDLFGLTEERKLEFVIRRIDKQRDLEILQADGNAAKIAEINGKYDKQIIDAKKATITAILDDNLKTIDAFSANSRQINEKIIASEKSTFEQRKTAINQLLDENLRRLDLQADAEKKKLDQSLITQHEYDVAIQEINNNRTAATIQNEEAITAVTLKEIDKRTNYIKGVFSLLQKSLQDTLGNTGLTTALTELENFGVTAQDVFEKIKAGVITTSEGMKEIASSAAGALQAISTQLFADQSAGRRQQLQETLDALSEQKDAELSVKNITEQQKADIEKKYKEKEKLEKIKAFNADKEAKKQQAIINGALGVLNALATAPTIIAGIILAALVVATTAVQVSTINRAQPPRYKRGKINIDGPGTTTSDSIHAMISKGESVINAESTARYKGALEAINNNQFDEYLKKNLFKHVTPQIPEDLIHRPSEGIDYDKLATSIAAKMAGVIPAPAQFHNTIDSEGLHQYIIKGSNKTEYKNQRYSMT